MKWESKFFIVEMKTDLREHQTLTVAGKQTSFQREKV